MTNQVDCIVIGAGIAGLVSAWERKRQGKNVLVLEPSDRVGGAIRSERIGDYLLEYGPNTVMPNPALIELIDSLGLKDSMALADPKLPRHVLFGGKMHTVPMSPSAFFSSSLLSWSGKMRLFAEPFIQKPNTPTDETLASFARRRLGDQVTDRLLAPFVSGVWAGDIERLSAASSFPRLVQWERDHGGLLKGAFAQKKAKKKPSKVIKGLLSFQDGLAVLPKTIAQKLGEAIQLKTLILEITPKNSGIWMVRTSKQEFETKNVIFASPAWETAKLIQSWDLKAAQTMEQIPYAPIAVVYLTYPIKDLLFPPQGFGFLIAPSEGSEVLGCLFSSNLFRGRCPSDRVLLTVFIGGSRHPNVARRSDEALSALAGSMIELTLGARRPAELIKILRYDRAIPQYELGHQEKVNVLINAEKFHPGLQFVGNYRGGISVGDVVQSTVSLMRS